MLLTNVSIIFHINYEDYANLIYKTFLQVKNPFLLS